MKTDEAKKYFRDLSQLETRNAGHVCVGISAGAQNTKRT